MVPPLLLFPKHHLLQSVADFPDREVGLHVKNKAPIAAPLLDGADHVPILAGIVDATQVVAQQVDDGVGRRELLTQPRDEPVPLVHHPRPSLHITSAAAGDPSLYKLHSIGNSRLPRCHCHGNNNNNNNNTCSLSRLYQKSELVQTQRNKKKPLQCR